MPMLALHRLTDWPTFRHAQPLLGGLGVGDRALELWHYYRQSSAEKSPFEHIPEVGGEPEVHDARARAPGSRTARTHRRELERRAARGAGETSCGACFDSPHDTDQRRLPQLSEMRRSERRRHGLGFTTISTRRLLARPSGVALSAIERVGPKPSAVMRSLAMPRETR